MVTCQVVVFGHHDHVVSCGRSFGPILPVANTFYGIRKAVERFHRHGLLADWCLYFVDWKDAINYKFVLCSLWI